MSYDDSLVHFYGAPSIETACREYGKDDCNDFLDYYCNRLADIASIFGCVYADGVFGDQCQRQYLLKKMKNKNIDCYCAIFTAKTDICMLRNSCRKNRLPQNIFWQSVLEYTVPTTDEGFTGVFYV